jgi:hypothetical protein
VRGGVTAGAAPDPPDRALWLNVWPGAIEDTNAATPADRAAAPPIIQRRTRETRATAASRSSAARGREPGPTVLGARIMLTIFAKQHQASVRAA